MDEQKPWGYSIGLDITECNPATIRSAALIQDYVIKLCKLIEMNRFGDCQVVHFGDGNKLGYSMVQLIETSCITGHFSEDTNCAYIDIFSCKPFSYEEVVTFSMEFFGGKECHQSAIERGVNRG